MPLRLEFILQGWTWLRRRPDRAVDAANPRDLWKYLPGQWEPAPGRSVLWGLLILLAVLLAWACLASIDVAAIASGKLVPEGKTQQLHATEISLVRAVHVKEGQRVKAGDLIVELDDTINRAEHKAVTQKLIQLRLERERLQAALEEREPVFDVADAFPESIAAQRALFVAQRHAHEARAAEAERNRQHRLMQQNAATAVIAKLQANLESARERVERVRPYAGESISHFEYLRLQDNANSLAGELASQRAAAQAARQEHLAAQQRLQFLEAEYRSSLLAQTQEKAALMIAAQSDQARIEQLMTQKRLRSPVDGQVQSLSVTTLGGAVTPGQVIASIVPEGMPLLIEAALSNEDAGFVRVGQRVDIKVDAFPYQQYGTLSGVVTWISPDAELRGSGSADAATGAKGMELSSLPLKGGLMYRLHIRPDSTALLRNGVRHPVGIGMSVQADIVTDRRRVIEFLLAPIIKNLDEGLKAR
ncbi:HlyD family type I secretion periplasmic adaptor subunit [Herbaspirillum seropedicae]|uniref:HlyD family type I secretion periplasmic adaptor subunit n=1 Tax=Herbaspirillum seropedicae TaxID=964 RepID=UPI0031CDFF62